MINVRHIGIFLKFHYHQGPQWSSVLKKPFKNGVFCDQSRVGHKMRLLKVNNIKFGIHINKNLTVYGQCPSYWNISKISSSSKAPVIFCAQKTLKKRRVLSVIYVRLIGTFDKFHDRKSPHYNLCFLHVLLEQLLNFIIIKAQLMFCSQKNPKTWRVLWPDSKCE